MWVESRTDTKKFMLTMIYAFNDVTERQELWRFLKTEALNCNVPWLWAGDFNTVLSPIERIEGNSTEVEMGHFQECVSLCSMEDIQATWALFTWTNKQEPEARVYSRLDRVMGNEEWQQEFGEYIAHFHPEGLFDHCPCTIVDRKVDVIGRRSFKYFNMWGMSELFQECVVKVWHRRYAGTKMFQLIKKLKSLKPVLKQLNKSCFSDIENSSTIASTLLEKLQKDLVDKPGDHELMQQEYIVAQELKELLAARDSFLI
ncbi:uncharacterized protein LOC141631410 [Silene latifolia]|uniref:uncharacterized protein LOC141631410 n=1 Tax=Silene latifolia TaxID=37657 RepID=UPI003D783782